MRSWMIAGVMVAVAFVSPTLSAEEKAASMASTELAIFIDEFVAYRANSQASDLSEASIAADLAETRARLKKLRAIDRQALSIDEDIDWRFAFSILRGEELRQAKIRAWVRDPRVYMQFRPIGRAIGRPGETDEKAEELIAVLEMLPRQLKSGRENLSEYIPRFQELSLYMAEGGLTMLKSDVPEFAASVPAQEARILKLAENAESALEAFMVFLDGTLPSKPRGTWMIGEETYTEVIQDQYLLDYDAAELYDYARVEFDRTVSELEAIAHKIDPSKTWQEIAVEVKNDYPEPDNMIEAHQLWVDKSKEHIIDNDLIPIPWLERVNVVEHRKNKARVQVAAPY